MSNHPKHDPQTAGEHAPLPATRISGKPVPDRVLIAPWGQVRSTNGTFVVDEESGRLVVEALAAHGTDLPIDYEHQTLGGRFSSPSGKAPAAGWIKAIATEPGTGLFATVSWTDTAIEHLAGGQYRYLSPVAVVRKSDRKLVALHSAALTNKPAIEGMRPIVNRSDSGGPVAESVKTDPSNRDEPLVALREQLGLDGSCSDEELMTAARRRIDALEQAGRQRDAEARVEPAVRAGKLTEALRPWAVTLALRDAELFDEWVKSAPVLIPPGRTDPPDRGARSHRTLQHLEAAARAEYHGHPELKLVTSEEAYVTDAIRDHELRIDPEGKTAEAARQKAIVGREWQRASSGSPSSYRLPARSPRRRRQMRSCA